MSLPSPRAVRRRGLPPLPLVTVLAAAVVGAALATALGDRSGPSGTPRDGAPLAAAGGPGARVLQARSATSAAEALYRALLDPVARGRPPEGWRLESVEPWAAVDAHVLEQLLDGATLGAAVSGTLTRNGREAQIVWFVIGTGAGAAAIVQLARERAESSGERTTRVAGIPSGQRAFVLADGSGWGQAGPVAIFALASPHDAAFAAGALRFAIGRAQSLERAPTR